MNEPTEPSFENILKRLEEIARLLESGQPQLEDALRYFEEGVRLSKQGGKQLDQAEKRLEILLEGDKIAPFDLKENGPSAS